MGIDTSGSMIVGAHATYVGIPEEYDGDAGDWLDDNGMVSMSEHYDADYDNQFWGFYVEDIAVNKIEEGWLKDIQEKAKKFEELTGVPALLIGTQDVY